MTHDRVMRFVPRFESSDLALEYAVAQARAWVCAAAPGPAPSTTNLE